jgi:DNA-binding MarR family transcriptional regulator
MTTENNTSNENNVMSETGISGETLLRLFRMAVRAVARAHHRQGNTQHAQGHVLAILTAQGPMSQHELMATLAVRSASLSEILAKLERNGLVSRERSEQDKRSFIISVSPQGREMAEEHKREHLKSAAAIFAPLSAAEQRQLREILQKIIAALDQDAPGRDEDYEAAHEHEAGPHWHCAAARHERLRPERRRSPRWEQHWPGSHNSLPREEQ